MAQQFRFTLTALAHAKKTMGAAIAHRHHEIFADENRQFARRPLTLFQMRQCHDDKEGRGIFFYLRALLAMAGIFDRQIVQIELVLYLPQLLVGGITQRDPDKAARPQQPLVDLLDGDVGQLASVLVGHAVDQHVMFPSLDGAVSSHGGSHGRLGCGSQQERRTQKPRIRKFGRPEPPALPG